MKLHELKALALAGMIAAAATPANASADVTSLQTSFSSMYQRKGCCFNTGSKQVKTPPQQNSAKKH